MTIDARINTTALQLANIRGELGGMLPDPDTIAAAISRTMTRDENSNHNDKVKA